MSVPLEDFQFEFGGVVFGFDCPIATDGEGFDPGIDSIQGQEALNTFNDSLAFGVDALEPSEWAWTLHTDKSVNATEARAAVRQLAAVWNDRELRMTPGAVAPLRYRIDGETRVVYGRPRPLGQVLNNQILYGVIPLSLEFKRADALHYEDQLRTFNVAMKPSSELGFTFPITFPLTTMVGTPTSATLAAFGGDADVPFEVTFKGPSVNPKLTSGRWEVGLRRELAAGESITVSTYPWAARAVRSDGVRLPGVLTMQTRLSKARLRPEGEALQYSAIDSSGTSTCTIAWRAAETTL